MSVFEDFQALRAAQEESWEKSRALQESILPQLEELADERELIAEKIEKLSSRILSEHGLSAFYDDELAKLVYEAGWLDGLGSSTWDKAVRRLLEEAGVYISPFSGGWRSSADGESTVFVWSICLPKLKDVDEEKLLRTADFLEKVYGPASKILGDTPYRFGIFEHSLSEYGSYYLVFDEEGGWSVTRSVYGSSFKAGEKADLLSVLKQVARDHWYE